MTKENSFSILKVCVECLNLNSSGYVLAYALIVLLIGVAHSREQTQTEKPYISGMPDFSQFIAPPPTLQTMMLQIFSTILTPSVYVSILKKFADYLDKLTGVRRRSFVHNIFVFFLFYYFIVSAPAAVMMPVNYDVKYDFHSIIALFLMMVTNAAGDVISYKITMKNVLRITKFQKIITESENTNFLDSIKTEATLYAMTIVDMILAAIICFFVLVLTSVYFGISIGEYKIEISQDALFGAYKRVMIFWDTAWEPYWISKNWGQVNGHGWPMLLIYSISSFIPSVMFIFFSLTWTFLMPIRIILFSKLNNLIKIIISEIIVIFICTIIMTTLEFM